MIRVVDLLGSLMQAQPAWIFCAGQWQECICGGRVKWGNDEKWQIIELPKDGWERNTKWFLLFDLVPMMVLQSILILPGSQISIWFGVSPFPDIKCVGLSFISEIARRANWKVVKQQ